MTSIMALNFPNTPTNGQVFTDPNGQQWVYETATNSWTAVGATSGGMIYKGGISITTAAPTGVQSGWLYLVTTGGAPHASFNGLANPTPTGTFILYDGTKWDDFGSASITNALIYKGTWSPTAVAPTGQQIGWVYALTPSGTLHTSWSGIGGLQAQSGQMAIWEGTKWELLGQGATVPDASMTIKGIVELATHAEVTTGTDDVRAVTPAGLHALTANETQAGLVELATAAETTTGTDDTRAVTPKSLKVELDKKLNLAGGTMTGHLSSTERTITAGAFNLATGNFWTCGAIAIPNPTNATAGTSGLIRLTAAPTGWGTNFKHAGGSATAPTAFPAIVPFYVQSASVILVGKPVEGMA